MDADLYSIKTAQCDQALIAQYSIDNLYKCNLALL